MPKNNKCKIYSHLCTFLLCRLSVASRNAFLPCIDSISISSNLIHYEYMMQSRAASERAIVLLLHISDDAYF